GGHLLHGDVTLENLKVYDLRIVVAAHRNRPDLVSERESTRWPGHGNVQGDEIGALGGRWRRWLIAGVRKNHKRPRRGIEERVERHVRGVRGCARCIVKAIAVGIGEA